MDRNRAAIILSVCLSIGTVVLVLALYITALRLGHGLNDTGLALLLLIEGSLTGIVGGYLSQSVIEHNRSTVGTILAITLGLTLLIIAAFVLTDSLRSETPALSPNTTKILAAMFGGIMGTLLGFMGLARPRDPEEEAVTTKESTMSTSTPEPVPAQPVEPDVPSQSEPVDPVVPEPSVQPDDDDDVDDADFDPKHPRRR